MSAPTYRFKWSAKILGGHVHITLFSCKLPGETWANCGNVCVSMEEFDQFTDTLKAPVQMRPQFADMNQP